MDGWTAYDGFGARLLATITGDTMPRVVAESGWMSLHLITDGYPQMFIAVVPSV